MFNNAPILSDQEFSILHDRDLVGNLLTGAYDPDGDPIRISHINGQEVTYGQAMNLPSGGSVTVQGDGSFTYTPPPNFVGTDSFSLTITDGLDSYTALVNIQVTNTAPVAYDAYFSALHDQQLTGQVDGNDPDGDAITAQLVSAPAHGMVDFVNARNGTFIYTPMQGYVGQDSFTYSWSDGIYVSNTATVGIYVYNNVPDAYEDTFTVPHNTELRIAKSELLMNDWDPDGDMLEVVRVAHPEGPGQLELLEDASIRYLPEPRWTGTVSFTYEVSDGISQVEGTAYITVYNDPPVAIGEMLTVQAGETFAIFDGEISSEYEGRTTNWADILRNDSDPNGDNLELKVLSDSLSNNPAWHRDDVLQAWIYTPSSEFQGVVASFRYYVTDGVPVNSQYSPTNYAGTAVSASSVATALLCVSSEPDGQDANAKPLPIRPFAAKWSPALEVVGDPIALPGGFILDSSWKYDPNAEDGGWHWVDTDRNGISNPRADSPLYPVVTLRNREMTVMTQFSVLEKGMYTVQAVIQAQASGIPENGIPLEGPRHTFMVDTPTRVILNVAKVRLPNAVEYYQNVEITYYWFPDPNTEPVRIGTVENRVHVLLDAPAMDPDETFISLIEISTRHGAGARDATELFRKIWEGFKSRRLYTLNPVEFEGHSLKYSGPGKIEPVRELLASGRNRGNSRQWAKLLIELMRTHGNNAAKPLKLVRVSHTDGGLVVNNMDTIENGAHKHSPVPGYPYLLVKSKEEATKGAYSDFRCVYPTDSIPSQGITTAKENKNIDQRGTSHYLVTFSDKYYDPAYGLGAFDKRQDWENAVLFGFYKYGNAPDIPGELIAVRKQDPNKEDASYQE